MKVNKKTYLQPNTTVLSVENVSMIAVVFNQSQVTLSKRIIATITVVSIMVVEKETICNYEL